MNNKDISNHLGNSNYLEYVSGSGVEGGTNAGQILYYTTTGVLLSVLIRCAV